MSTPTRNFNADFSEESLIVFHEGKYQVKVKKIWSIYNPVLTRWEIEKTEIEYRGLHMWHPNGLFKVLEGQAIIKRESINPHNLKPMVGFFLQNFRVEADKTNPSEYVSQFKGGFYLHDLEHGVSQPLHITDYRIKPVGGERRISEAEAVQLVKTKNLPVFSDFGKGGLVTELRS